MTQRTRTLAVVVFSLAVIASGLGRFLLAEGGHKGLWFGLVMGGLGLAGAALMRAGWGKAGTGVAAFAVLLVGGWFFFESFIRKGWASAEWRQIIVLALAVVVAVVLCVPSRARD
ncbi:MAG: hypothetical protein AAGD14_18500 [Planctomycetota bacterium]